MRGEVTGTITIVQEDRIRVVDDEGRGYLFVVRRGAATHDALVAWRDAAVRVRVRFVGTPDAGAKAVWVTATSSPGSCSDEAARSQGVGQETGRLGCVGTC